MSPGTISPSHVPSGRLRRPGPWVRRLLAALLVLGTNSGLARAAYWNVFNVEGESAFNSALVTYGTLGDMLADTNRLSLFEPALPFGRNIVGSDSDGTTYWNVFNIEGESAFNSALVTYGTLGDMLADTNRLGLFEPALPFGRNIVGSGANILTRPPTPVPEPATAMLLAAALAGLAWMRRADDQRARTS